MKTGWLFTRGFDSVRLILPTTAHSFALVIEGPAFRRTTHTFSSQQLLLDFQHRYERHLIAAGYALVSFTAPHETGDQRAETPGATEP